jgi:leader peptidase (prepilin peptidase)/N-methyltransferase
MAEFRPDWRDIGILIATSGLLALLDVRFDPFWDHLPTVIAVLFFLLVAIVDLKHRLVLNAMVLPASGFVLLARMMDSGESLVPTLLGAGVGLFPFLLTALAKPGSMGGGDVKLAALIGLALGFPEVLWAISLGILGGGIVSIVFLLSRRFQASDHLPYAPFLCLGAITALLYDPLTPLLLSMAR